MAAFVNKDGKRFELPKLTLRLQELNDRAASETNARSRVELELEFLNETLGSEYVESLFGLDLDEIDVVELSTLFMRVGDVYLQPMFKEAANRVNQAVKVVKPLTNAAHTVSTFSNQ